MLKASKLAAHGLYESAYVDRVRVAAELHDARELVMELFDLALATGNRRIAQMCAEAIVQCAQVQRRYLELHRPARPYATDEQIGELKAERMRKHANKSRAA